MEIWQRNQNGLFPMNTKILSSITEYGLPDTCTLLVLSTGQYNSIFFFGSSKETTFMTISWDVAEKFLYLKYPLSVIYSCIHYPTVLYFWRKFHSQIYGGWNFTLNFTRLWNFLPLIAYSYQLQLYAAARLGYLVLIFVLYDHTTYNLP